MYIEVLDRTEFPITIISLAAGQCYGHDNVSVKRVERAIRNKHFSVLEHAKFTVRISGLSRACSHQLVRHRMASFCQESQRYVTSEFGDDWYVMPDEIKDAELENEFEDLMAQIENLYDKMIDRNVAPQNARSILPNAAKTKIIMTMNLREFAHFHKLRTDNGAQEEIRYLAESLRIALLGRLGDPQDCQEWEILFEALFD